MDGELSPIGSSIGNYRIISRLSAGTFGSVYLASHIVFASRPKVAIKLLHANIASQSEREHFLQEARFLEKLRHPSILSIIDAGLSNNFAYLVVEYAPNGSLRDRIRAAAPKPLSSEEAIKILLQISQALAYAHQQNIILRDIKP